MKWWNDRVMGSGPLLQYSSTPTLPHADRHQPCMTPPRPGQASTSASAPFRTHGNAAAPCRARGEVQTVVAVGLAAGSCQLPIEPMTEGSARRTENSASGGRTGGEVSSEAGHDFSDDLFLRVLDAGDRKVGVLLIKRLPALKDAVQRLARRQKPSVPV